MSRGYPASPVFTTLGLVGQRCCQKSLPVDRWECVCVFIFALRKHLEENTIKRALQYVRWLTTSTFPSPHWRQRHKSHNDHYPKESSISCQRSAARRSNGANPEDDTLQWRHDNTAYAPSSFVRRQISRWRHRWSKQLGGGGVFFRLVLLSFDVCTWFKVVFHEVHTEDYRCIKVQRPVRQWGTFYVAYEACNVHGV